MGTIRKLLDGLRGRRFDPELLKLEGESRERLLELTGLSQETVPEDPGWSADADLLLCIARQVLSRKPRCVVELGSGVSTGVIARCLDINNRGRLVSFEHDPKYFDATSRALENARLTSRVELVLAPLKPVAFGGEDYSWYDPDLLSKIDGPIDMLLVDGPPGGTCTHARYPAGPFLFPRIARRGMAFVDDTDRAEEREIAERFLQQNRGFEKHRIATMKGAFLLVRRPIFAS